MWIRVPTGLESFPYFVGQANFLRIFWPIRPAVIVYDLLPNFVLVILRQWYFPSEGLNHSCQPNFCGLVPESDLNGTKREAVDVSGLRVVFRFKWMRSIQDLWAEPPRCRHEISGSLIFEFYCGSYAPKSQVRDFRVSRFIDENIVLKVITLSDITQENDDSPYIFHASMNQTTRMDVIESLSDFINL